MGDYFTKIGDYLAMMDPMAIAVIAGVLVAIGGMVWMTRRKTKERPLYIKPVVISAKGKKQEDKQEKKQSLVGTGKYKAYVIRPGGILEATTIPEPIGEVYYADTSMPESGAHYLVMETEDGEIIDYDPRDLPIVTEETPEYAWFATHWDIVDQVFAVPIPWWQNTANWYAAAMMAIVFITGLAVVG